MKSGEVCYGGFNLKTREGWVALPDGTKLTGKIFEINDAHYASQSFNGNTATVDPRGAQFGSFTGTGISSLPAHRGEVWALLRSADGAKLMEMHAISSGSVSSGYGAATINDGRSFRIVW